MFAKSKFVRNALFTLTLQLLLPIALYLSAANVSKSPRIEHLQSDYNQRGCEAIYDFWTDAYKEGTPFLDQKPGDPQSKVITFIYFAPPGSHKVALMSDLAPDADMDHFPHTNLWWKTCESKQDLRTLYNFYPNSNGLEVKSIADSWKPDPFNKHQYIYPPGTFVDEDGGVETKEVVSSILELPKAPSQPYVKERCNVPKGNLESYTFHSQILGNTRDIWIYTPASYSLCSEPYHFMVLFDGELYTSLVPTPTILDNMIFEKAIPPMVVLFIGNVDQQTRDIELPCYPPFFNSLSYEFVPWARGNYNITNVPQKTIIAGSSYGGLAAVYAAIVNPDVFGNVLSQSGAFYWKPVNADKPSWIISKVRSTSKLPIKFYLEAGKLETHESHDFPSILRTNREMWGLLQEKGYTVKYQEYNGGHDYFVWQGTLSEGLISLFKKMKYER